MLPFFLPAADKFAGHAGLKQRPSPQSGLAFGADGLNKICCLIVLTVAAFGINYLSIKPSVWL
jgi:hypothetical protein